MDWNENKGENKKRFREALQKVYPEPVDLEIFVYEALNENLSTITTETSLYKIIFKLVQWAEAKGRLDELYNEFCQANSKNPAVAELKGDRFLRYHQKITSDQWDMIFAAFNDSDLNSLSFACDLAFFKHSLPSSTSLDTIEMIREILSRCDDPDLTKTFVQCAVENIQKLDPSRDFSNLNDWLEGQQHLSETQEILAKLPTCGYLLISFEETAGRVSVNAELYLKGQKPQTLERGFICELDGSYLDESPDIASEKISEQIAPKLSKWVEQAEQKILNNPNCAKRPISIELFLPYQLLGERIDEWQTIDEFGDRCKLSVERGFIVRSFERATKPGLRLKLEEGWRILKMHVENSSLSANCVEIDCTCDPSLSEIMYANISGVKLPKGLPEDPDIRKEALKKLVKAPVPIAFWTNNPKSDCRQVITAFDRLLKRENLEEFANLAREIKNQRISTSPIQTLGMLCDCPDRLPSLEAETPLLIPS